MKSRDIEKAKELMSYLENTTWDDPELVKKITEAVKLLLVEMLERHQE